MFIVYKCVIGFELKTHGHGRMVLNVQQITKNTPYAILYTFPFIQIETQPSCHIYVSIFTKLRHLEATHMEHLRTLEKLFKENQLKSATIRTTTRNQYNDTILPSTLSTITFIYSYTIQYEPPPIPVPIPNPLHYSSPYTPQHTHKTPLPPANSL